MSDLQVGDLVDLDIGGETVRGKVVDVSGRDGLVYLCARTEPVESMWVHPRRVRKAEPRYYIKPAVEDWYCVIDGVAKRTVAAFCLGSEAEEYCRRANAGGVPVLTREG